MDNLLSPSHPIGTVTLGIITAVLAAILIAPATRGRAIRSIRRLLQPMPRLRRILRVIGDAIFPTWRADAGETRLNYLLDWRLIELRRMWQPPVVIVGGVYLDVYLSPVDVKDLRLGSEYGNLDTVRVECGGSAYFVAKYLFDRYRRRSHVFSRIGAGDALSDGLQALLKRERWSGEVKLQRVDKSQCGVSAHLLQHNGRHITLTHKGALESLRWGQILPKLQRKTRRGGVLYISGYFRTGLHVDLCPTLEKLSPKLLICIDHGRFRKEESATEAAALVGAFEQGLIDVYICTYAEIEELLASVGVEVNEATTQEEALKQFRSAGKLPPVTIVRPDTETPHWNAYVMFRDRVEVVPADGGPVTRNDHPGQKNRFNAGLVHALLTGSPSPHLPSVILDATRSALSA